MKLSYIIIFLIFTVNLNAENKLYLKTNESLKSPIPNQIDDANFDILLESRINCVNTNDSLFMDYKYEKGELTINSFYSDNVYKLNFSNIEYQWRNYSCYENYKLYLRNKNVFYELTFNIKDLRPLPEINYPSKIDTFYAISNYENNHDIDTYVTIKPINENYLFASSALTKHFTADFKNTIRKTLIIDRNEDKVIKILSGYNACYSKFNQMLYYIADEQIMYYNIKNDKISTLSSFDEYDLLLTSLNGYYLFMIKQNYSSISWFLPLYNMNFKLEKVHPDLLFFIDLRTGKEGYLGAYYQLHSLYCLDKE